MQIRSGEKKRGDMAALGEFAASDGVVDLGREEAMGLKFLGRVPLGRLIELDCVGEKAVKQVGLPGWIGVEPGHLLPGPTGRAAFFPELALSACERSFPGVEHAAGEFQAKDAGAMAILANQHDPSIGQHGNHVHKIAFYKHIEWVKHDPVRPSAGVRPQMNPFIAHQRTRRHNSPRQQHTQPWIEPCLCVHRKEGTGYLVLRDGWGSIGWGDAAPSD